MSGFLDYNGIRLLNVPAAISVYDEVITRNIYRAETIPDSSTVLDVGAFYGEFALLCLQRGHRVIAHEPSWQNLKTLVLNVVANQHGPRCVVDYSAVGEASGSRDFYHDAQHPAGSKFSVSGDAVRVLGINEILREWPTINAVKLDCEGAEREILPVMDFSNINWLAMEWHDCDGDFYGDILLKNGFGVELSCDGGNSGGIIRATK